MAMILTVTPDPVLDKIFFINEWTPGIPMTAHKTTTSVGGKGLDASVALRHLGQETVGLAFLAGQTGKELADMIRAYGIVLEPVWAGGTTRTAHIVSEIQQNRHTHLFSGSLEIDAVQAEEFYTRFSSLLPGASWVICGGIIPSVLPAGFYEPIIRRAIQSGVPVLIDTFRQFILDALPAKPTVVKMNLREFGWTFGQEYRCVEDLLPGAARVYQLYELNALVVTCGAEGIFAITPEGVFHALPPRIKAINATGAGDAASAAIAWRRSLGDPWDETLRWAAAVSAAVVLTEGTADCRPEDVENIYPQVDLHQLPK